MNCHEFRKRCETMLGNLHPDEQEREHLESCPACRDFYRSLEMLQDSLNEISASGLSPAESMRLEAGLDERINRYQQRSLSFYRISLRVSTAVAALVLVVFIGLWTGSDQEAVDTEFTSIGEMFIFDSSADEENLEFDEEYVNIVIDDYVDRYGFESGGQLLGDISEEELEYLNSTFDMGDIL